MNFSTDELFALLPAFLRLRDASEGAASKARLAADHPGATADPREAADFGPLRTLASLVARWVSDRLRLQSCRHRRYLAHRAGWLRTPQIDRGPR